MNNDHGGVSGYLSEGEMLQLYGRLKMSDEKITSITNGKPAAKAQAQVTVPLRESRQRAIEAGLRAQHETYQQVEEQKQEIENLVLDLKSREMEIASLKERIQQKDDDHAMAITGYESRIAGQAAERDQAVAEAAILKTIIAAIKRTIGIADPAPVADAD